MNINLKSLQLINFKGIRNLVIDFDSITNIYGDNATGKTTIFDSFLWLLFGKNSRDEKDFEIKTLNERNLPFHKLDHEVIGMFEVNGEEIIIRRVFREKWVKQRGKTEAEFTGHETEFYYNNVPLQLKEYQAKIASICEETLFKLLTNTGYFNSLKWQDKRAILLSLVPEISDKEIANGDTDFENLLTALSGKNLQEYRAQLSASKQKLKKQLEEIPTRIQEANRAMPEPTDYAAIEKDIEIKQAELVAIETGLANEAEAAKENNRVIAGKISEQQSFQTAIQKIKFSLHQNIIVNAQQRESEISEKKAKLRLLSNALDDYNRELFNIEKKLTSLESERENLRNKWHEVNSKQFVPLEYKFDEKTCVCPTCKQNLPEETITAKKLEMEKNHKESEDVRLLNFNTDKATMLANIVSDGKFKAAVVDNLTKRKEEIIASRVTKEQVSHLQNQIAELEIVHRQYIDSEKSQYEKAVAESNEINKLNEMLNSLEQNILALQQPASKLTYDLNEKKKATAEAIDNLKLLLSGKQHRESQLKRVQELETQERDFAQQIADLEKREFTIQRFERCKMDLLEEKVNSMFAYVKFKMFESQINGGETPTCVALINGIPYSDANNAARINAGLDIIRVLSKYHNITAPIFIDNAESVTKLISVDSQVIRLVVSSGDKKLRIQNAVLEQVA